MIIAKEPNSSLFDDFSDQNIISEMASPDLHRDNTEDKSLGNLQNQIRDNKKPNILR